MAPTGADGADGADLVSQVPDDVVFSFAVVNDGGESHKGALAVLLDFDGTSPDHQTVAATYVERPPWLDGRDDGVAAWGNQESHVALDATVGTPDAIPTALLRAAYDDDYVYFFASWDESGESGAGIGETYRRREFTYDGKEWARRGSEDRVFFAFPITPIVDWDTQGCQTACHGEVMHTANEGELVDVWQYKHARTGPTMTADDKWWDYEGRHRDLGEAAYLEPVNDGSPVYQYLTDPGASIDYPVWTWEMVPFDEGAAWTAGDTIPGVINRTPSGSRADVAAVCRFATPTWTCEFKRLQNTGNADDYQF